MSKQWTYGLVHQGDFREIEKEEVVVGRSRTCDVRIGDPSVSRKHFRLLVSDGTMTVQDLGSSNGTYVNDALVHDRQTLTHGDRVTIGDIDVFAHIEQKADTRPFSVVETRQLEDEDLEGLAAADKHPAKATVTESGPGGTPDEVTDPSPVIEKAPAEPVPETWPIDEPPDEVAGLPLPGDAMSTQRFDEAILAEPGSSPVAEAEGNPRETRLIEHDFLDQGPEAWSTPPPPASLTPPPVQFVPAPDVPELPKPEDPPAESSTPAPPSPAFEPPPPLREPAVETVSPVETKADASSPRAVGSDDTFSDATQSTSRRSTSAPAEPLATGLPPEPPRADPQPPTPNTRLGADDLSGALDGEILGSVKGFDETMMGLPVQPATATDGPAPDTTTAAVPPSGRPALKNRSGAHARPGAAGFWIRAVAAILESTWAVGLGFGLAHLLGTAEDPITRQSAYALAAAVAGLVVLVGWSIWGTTPAKRIFRLYVCTPSGQPGIGPLRALVRAVGYLLGFLTLGIGFLMAAFGTKQALHDRIAGTYVGRLR